MGLIDYVEPVFVFLRDFFDCLPTAVQLLISSAFGGVVFIGILRDIRS